MRKVHVAASTEYDVLIGEGLIDKAGELTKKVVRPCRCLIVTESASEEYARELCDFCERELKRIANEKF